MGDEPHQVALEEQHKAFVRVHRIMKRSKQRQAKYANRNAVDIEFKIGDPVYYKNNTRQSKLQSKWLPYYRIIKQISPVTFKIKNQLTNKVTKAHKELLRLAKMEWEAPTNEQGRPLRKAAYVVPPDSESDSEDREDSLDKQPDRDNEKESEIGNSDSDESDNLSVSPDREPMTQDDSMSLNSSASDSEDNIPLAKLAGRYRKERDDSSDEDDIPLWELSKRLKTNKRIENELNPDQNDFDDEPSMDIDACHKTKYKKLPTKRTRKVVKALAEAVALLL